MSVYYVPPDRDKGLLGYWATDTPGVGDIITMVTELLKKYPRKQFVNFVVIGLPTRISAQWLAKHPNYTKGSDYVVSYSVDIDVVEYLAENTETAEDFFNLYMEDYTENPNLWVSIVQINVIDRR